MSKPALITKNATISAYTWALPAGPGVCAGFNLQPGSVCNSCYAAQGRFAMPNVADAMAYRLAWWRSTPLPERVATLAALINRTRTPFFRVFTSGDFTTPADVDAWQAIARACPSKRFWISTRAWRDPAIRARLATFREPNVVVRLSALEIDVRPPAGLGHPTSGVTATGPGCPKQTAGSCEAAGCRACWDPAVPHVDYALHGRAVRWQGRKVA